ncbi:hypothetical protein COU62_03210 [Candidatus Pacearchaeota archaeon CG10_big_fil_rev_8_21_14_0_10_35_219]|nr:hypothetical protein [Candidatus Pacearchaeota archaeon]PIO07538.1 MAG: hypothetical protein COU62_03210 [Candidatus Pacearchaeota archaeon CG10_big_fil_rev_8_21_14_0_10_35_219]PIY81751.1 MAG: hypothetical protein COY79_01000 [Candidatus Pacearchaeota archaeon CG_4_10_14_0_8_um_filter_35_169]PIZ78996.1 MAG: hypothetical protein COY00_04500 [Candidatus Pacearchaeota archaeon CG_4_10_14_0_2_um_filter_35_33]PJA69789.1 MAG: hypothetical protein CO155_03410 [Candidatus Pacearchaeota archaeon CG_4
MKKARLYWLPRILTIVLIIFISIFALDVFSDFTGVELLVALFMHLIPSLILIVVLVVAWKWEKIGGILFIITAIVTTIFFKTYQDIIVFLLISLPPLAIGILFLINSKNRKKTKRTKK